MDWAHQRKATFKTVHFRGAIVSSSSLNFIEIDDYGFYFFCFYFDSEIKQKIRTLKEWHQCGKDNNLAGCFLLGYEAFRVLINYNESKKGKERYSTADLNKIGETVHKYLLDPGADLVVCDEGHMIKNQKSTTSLAVNKIKTRRRIVLTGTPIQNNLKECKMLHRIFHV